MAKRSATDLVGYVIGLSPQKKNKTFHVQMQTEDPKAKRIVCFNKAKHVVFSYKKVSGDPIKIKNIIHQENLPQKGFADYVVNMQSQIIDVDPVNISFSRNEEETKYFDLSEDLQLGLLINVKALIDMSNSFERSVLLGSKTLRVLNNVILHNDKGEVKLSMWEEWIDHLQRIINNGAIYVAFKNLIVQEYHNELCLATCSETDCAVLADEHPASIFTPGDAQCTIPAFDSVSVNFNFICLCGNVFKAITDTLVKCDKCKTTTRSLKLKQDISILVKSDNLPDASKLYHLDIIDVERCVPDISPITVETDSDKISESVMSLSNITVLVKNDTNLSILFEE